MSLKQLSTFWRTLDIPLISCEIELILTWSKSCVLADMTVRDAGGDDPATVAPTVRILNKIHKIVCSSSYLIIKR